MNRITVGLYNDAYLPIIDGVTMVVQNYARLINENHGKCFVVAPTFPGYKDNDKFEIIRYNSVPLIGKSPYRAGLPFLDHKYASRMKTLKADIIHSHTPFGSGISGLINAKSNNIPLVTTFHSKYYDDFKQAFRSSLIAELGVDAILKFYNRADSVWAVNKSTANTLKDYGFKGNIEIMPNGTEFTPPENPELECQKVNETLGINASDVLLLFVGRIVWAKNVDKLAKAISTLKSKDIKFKMAVAGSGEAYKGLSELIDELDIGDRMVLLGGITDRNYLKSLYTRADLFVFPSLYDNSPIVVKEAAACSCPSLVIRDSNSAEGVTDGVNGFLCEDHPDSIAKKIIELLSNRHLLKKVGEAASKTLYTPWETIIEKAYSRYIELIEERSQRSQQTHSQQCRTPRRKKHKNT